jgi:hypothetical protein
VEVVAAAPVEVPAKRRERRRDNKIHVNDAEISRNITSRS